MPVLANIRNAIGSRLMTQDQKVNDALEKAGLFMLRQEDFMIRHRHLQLLNEFLENPHIEIDDKLRRVNRAFGEVASSFGAMGDDPVMDFGAKCWKRAMIQWGYDYPAIKNSYSFWTAKINIDEPHLELESNPEDGKTAKYTEVFEMRQEEVDADTYLYYFKTMNKDRLELIEAIPHGGIEEGVRRALPPWRWSQDKLHWTSIGMELAHACELSIWRSFKDKHVNPRSVMVLHTGVAPDQRGRGPQSAPSGMSLESAAAEFQRRQEEARKNGQI